MGIAYRRAAIGRFKSQVSNSKSQISNSKSQIRNPKPWARAVAAIIWGWRSADGAASYRRVRRTEAPPKGIGGRSRLLLRGEMQGDLFTTKAAKVAKSELVDIRS